MADDSSWADTPIDRMLAARFERAKRAWDDPLEGYYVDDPTEPTHLAPDESFGRPDSGRATRTLRSVPDPGRSGALSVRPEAAGREASGASSPASSAPPASPSRSDHSGPGQDDAGGTGPGSSDTRRSGPAPSRSEWAGATSDRTDPRSPSARGPRDSEATGATEQPATPAYRPSSGRATAPGSLSGGARASGSGTRAHPSSAPGRRSQPDESSQHPTGRISGTVRNGYGRGLSHMKVEAVTAHGYTVSRAATQAGGRFVLEDVPAEPIRVRVVDVTDDDYAEGWYGGTERAVGVSVRAGGDHNSVNVELLSRARIELETERSGEAVNVGVQVIQRSTGGPADGEARIALDGGAEVIVALTDGLAQARFSTSPDADGGSTLRVVYLGNRVIAAEQTSREV